MWRAEPGSQGRMFMKLQKHEVHTASRSLFDFLPYNSTRLMKYFLMDIASCGGKKTNFEKNIETVVHTQLEIEVLE